MGSDTQISRSNMSAANEVFGGRVVDTERTPLIQNAQKKGTEHHTAGHMVPPPMHDSEITIICQDLSAKRRYLILMTAWIGCFLSALDSTIIATLSGPISSDFRSLSLLSWLATAYIISTAVCQPLSGRLTDIFGRGPGLVLSHTFFSMGNLLCGFATNQQTIIVGRVVAGIGGGGLMSIAAFLCSDLVPLRSRGLVQGLANIWYGSGAMLGGVIGGLVNDHTDLGWRLAFFIQVPPSILSILAILILVKVPPKHSNASYLARIDFFGAFLICLCLILMLFGISMGGNLVPWMHPLPLVTIPSSLVVCMGFVWWESKAAQPIIPVKLLASRTIIAACLCNVFASMVFTTALFYVPLYLQVRGYSATDAGVTSLPSPIGASMMSLVVGYVVNRTGNYVGLGVASLLVLLAGSITMSLQTAETPRILTAIALFLVGGGFSAMLTITLLACISALDQSQQAVMTSTICE